jgi:hypothetical protein
LPTPVSALIHAATMVSIKSCREIMKIISLLSCYMLEINHIKFIYTVVSKQSELNKKILCFNTQHLHNIRYITPFRNWLMLSKILKVYNQQEYLYKFYSSETRSKITFMFNTYFNNKPQQINKINSQFLEWFIGFTEGDGSFIISHNKVYFDIRQNIEDIQVLYYIKKNLGFGKIQVRAEIHRRVAVFFVTSKEHFYRLMLIFNGNLVSNYKSNQFKTWVNAFNNQYSENVYFIENKVEPSLSSA